MSPRAACRLERLGFEQVYDYVTGIADWKAAGLPTEGTALAIQRVADATRPDVPVSTLDETIGDVRQRTLDAGWEESVVVDCDGTVIGRLRNNAWEADAETLVENVMESGPTTVRPDGPLHPSLREWRSAAPSSSWSQTPRADSSVSCCAKRRDAYSQANRPSSSGRTATDAPDNGKSSHTPDLQSPTRLTHADYTTRFRHYRLLGSTIRVAEEMSTEVP